MPCNTGHFFNDKMMKTKRLFFLLIAGVVLNACNTKPTANMVMGESKNATTKINFSITDSVELNFYKQSGNQKEKQTFLIKDTTFINTLIQNLSVPIVDKNECSHNLKMYLFNNGEVYKTIYVALGDSCQYLAYALNSTSYFVPLNTELENKLQQLVTNFKASESNK